MMGNPIILSAACLLLPILDQPHDGIVSVEVTQAQGELCVRIGNGTAAPVRYGHGDGWIGLSAFHIERENGGRWDYITAGTFFAGLTEGPPLAPGAIRYHAVPPRERPSQPERYRGCLQFFQDDAVTWQEVCSEPFLLSPKELRSPEKRP